MRQSLLIGVLLIAVTLLVYGQVVEFEFVEYDDPVFVSNNPRVNEGVTTSGIVWAFTGNLDFWRPISVLSHMLDCQLFGLAAGSHHLTSLLLHVLNTLLLFGVLKQMTRRVGPSAMVAALFALHPLHVESVVWVAERKDVLSTCFALLAIGAYGWYVRRGGMGRYGLIMLFFALSLMSKPMVVTLPALLLLMDYWPLDRLRTGGRQSADRVESPRVSKRPQSGNGPVSRGFLLIEKLPLFALSVASGVVTYKSQQSIGTVIELELIPIHLRVENAVVAYAWYVLKAFWPVDLSAIYLHPNIPGGTPWKVWQIVGAGLLMMVLSVWVVCAWRSRYLVVGWLWFLGTLVPVIGLVQVGMHAFADRYTYIPLIGLFIMVAWGGAELVLRWSGSMALVRPAALLLGLSVVAGCGVGAWAQTRHWRDSVALFEHALAVTPDNHIAHAGLGRYYLTKQKADEAIWHNQRALEIDRDWFIAHHNLADALKMKGSMDEAVRHYQEALKIEPDLFEAHYNLAAALEQKGKLERAAFHFRRAAHIRPGHIDAHFNLGRVHHALGRLDEAAVSYGTVLHLDPTVVEAQVNWGHVLVEQKKFNDGIKHYREALRVRPDLPEGHYYLGAALEEQGLLDEAIAHYREALWITSVTGADQLADQIRRRLERYEND